MHSVVTIVPLYLSFHQVISNLVIIPLDTEVHLNQSTYLNCTTGHPSQEVAWYHYRAGDPYRRISVYDGGIMERAYRQRFRIEGGQRATGEFNLVIESAQGQDAGRYECQDDEGMGEKRSANIVVLEDELRCSSDAQVSGVVGPNDCGLRPDVVQLSCRVRFKGEVAPKLKWTVRNGDPSDVISGGDSLCWTSANEHFCNMTLSVDRLQLSETSFICETSRLVGQRQTNCTADRLKIMYAFDGKRVQVARSIGGEVNCSANSSQPCLYSWSQVKNGEEVNISDNAMFVPQVAGLYRCLARCPIGGRVCALEALHVHVFYAQESDCGQRTPLFVPWLTAFGTAAAVAAAVACFIAILIAAKKRRLKDKPRIEASGDDCSSFLQRGADAKGK